MPPSSAPSHITSRYGLLVGRPRIWAIASIHAELTKLEAIHDAIVQRLHPRDAIVYLGNLFGYGTDIRGTVTELLNFRRAFIARRESFASDVVYLRGCQEEMWQKLLELQLAPNPVEVYQWMLDHGLAGTLTGYGYSPRDGLAAMRGGPAAITRWTRAIRATLQGLPGHTNLIAALKRAAFTSTHSLLFVNAGLDPVLKLDDQQDAFWWGAGSFYSLDKPYDDFGRVIRGYDPAHQGFIEHPYLVSLDHGAGFGGKLIAACITAEGQVIECFEA